MTREEIAKLVDRTEVRDIRMIRFNGELLRTPPDEAVSVEVTTYAPQYRKEDALIIALFGHKLQYAVPNEDDEKPDAEPEPVGSFEVFHVVEVALSGEQPPRDAAVVALIETNLYFMVYPYVRSALHRLPTEFGLDGVLLPYLRREAAAKLKPSPSKASQPSG